MEGDADEAVASRARRLARRAVSRAEEAAKALGRRLRDLGPQGLCGYDTERNPFADPKLHRRFVWKAKIERDTVEAYLGRARQSKEGADNQDTGEAQDAALEDAGEPEDSLQDTVERWEALHWERVSEVAHVKRRRLEREAEQARRGEARDVRQRELALAQFLEWERQDEAFHLAMDERRTRTRVSQNRARPVDHLARLLLDADALIDALRKAPANAADVKVGIARGLQQCPQPGDVIGNAMCNLDDLARDASERQRTAAVNGLEPHAVFWEDVLIACARGDAGTMSTKADREASVAALDTFYAGLRKRACEEAGIEDTVGEEMEGEDGIVEDREEKPFDEEVVQSPGMDSSGRRRPRYANHVVSGYEWNEYNRAHYTSERPPPREVKGYRFTVFYPDLAPEMPRPTWKLEEDPDTAEEGQGVQTVRLRFVAPPGSPYDDLVFRVVSKEWSRKRKHGFRDSYADGVLRLHFNFVRLRYRR